MSLGLTCHDCLRSRHDELSVIPRQTSEGYSTSNDAEKKPDRSAEEAAESAENVTSWRVGPLPRRLKLLLQLITRFGEAEETRKTGRALQLDTGPWTLLKLPP